MVEKFLFCLLCEEGERSAEDEGERGRAFGVYVLIVLLYIFVRKIDENLRDA
jgi:hypothetical protein